MSFPVAVVDLAKLGFADDRKTVGLGDDAGGVHGSRERACVDGGEFLAGKTFAEALRLVLPLFGQGNIRGASKAVFGGQIGSAVTDQEDAGAHRDGDASPNDAGLGRGILALPLWVGHTGAAMATANQPVQASSGFAAKGGPWVDLGLTLPIFVAYHLGVVTLDVRNATDLVTAPLLDLAEGNREMYLVITGAIGVVFAGVFALAGRGQVFHAGKFLQIALEGAVYAFVMRFAANYVVGHLFAGVAGALPQSIAGAASAGPVGPWAGLIMSMGAGFYEEIAFRVVLFGLGAQALVGRFSQQRFGLLGPSSTPSLTLRSFLMVVGWAVVAAALFSGVHYVGAMGDRFELATFTFRFVLGLALTLIYAARGFAAAVWTHTLYDVWVLVF